GPYTGVNCTLTLLNSSQRKSAALKDDQYARQAGEDDRFIDSFSAAQSVVISSGQNDSGLFETNLRDDRLLPFEGAGAQSTWKIELPERFRHFDYNTIADVILHIRYTARDGGAPLRQKAQESLENLLGAAGSTGLSLLASLNHDFPNEWRHYTS